MPGGRPPRPAIPEAEEKLAAGFFLPQIHAFEAQRKIGRRRIHVHANHVELRQLRQQAGSQIAGDSRDHYSWF